MRKAGSPAGGWHTRTFDVKLQAQGSESQMGYNFQFILLAYWITESCTKPGSETLSHDSKCSLSFTNSRFFHQTGLGESVFYFTQPHTATTPRPKILRGGARAYKAASGKCPPMLFLELAGRAHSSSLSNVGRYSPFLPRQGQQDCLDLTLKRPW